MRKIYVAFGLFLLSSYSALASVQSVERVAELLARNPSYSYDVTTKTIHDPVTITVNAGNTTVATATDNPEIIVRAIRAKIASHTLSAGGYSYLVGWQSLDIVKDGKLTSVYDLLTDIRANEVDPSDATASEQDGDIFEKFQVLSAVGPYISFRLIGDSYSPGAAHPNSWDDIVTVDATKASSDDHSANLLDLVDEASLVAALKADTSLNKLLTGANAIHAFKKAATLEQVNEALFEGLQANCYSFPGIDNKISEFAVYDYDLAKNLVSIRIPLTAAAHVCQGDAPLLQLGLQVKPLLGFQFQLSEQAKSGDGLLMKNAPKM